MYCTYDSYVLLLYVCMYSIIHTYIQYRESEGQPGVPVKAILILEQLICKGGRGIIIINMYKCP